MWAIANQDTDHDSTCHRNAFLEYNPADQERERHTVRCQQIVISNRHEQVVSNKHVISNRHEQVV